MLPLEGLKISLVSGMGALPPKKVWVLTPFFIFMLSKIFLLNYELNKSYPQFCS